MIQPILLAARWGHMTSSHQQNLFASDPCYFWVKAVLSRCVPLIFSLPFSLPVGTGHMEGSPKKQVEADVLRWVSGRWIRAPHPIYTGLAHEQEIRKQNPEYRVIEAVLRK